MVGNRWMPDHPDHTAASACICWYSHVGTSKYATLCSCPAHALMAAREAPLKLLWRVWAMKGWLPAEGALVESGGCVENKAKSKQICGKVCSTATAAGSSFTPIASLRILLCSVLEAHRLLGSSDDAGHFPDLWSLSWRLRLLLEASNASWQHYCLIQMSKSRFGCQKRSVMYYIMVLVLRLCAQPMVWWLITVELRKLWTVTSQKLNR